MLDKIESKALKVTVFANLIMAVAGWLTFYFTNSQAMLLDGNFSFVLAVSTLVAIYISRNKHNRTNILPFGSYAYEAAFVLTKGFIILGIIVMAFIQNAIKIIDFFNGEIQDAVILEPIYYYTIFILIVTFILIWYFGNQNKKADNRSSILLVELKSAKVDGVLTISTGIAFFVISFINIGSTFDFLIYIGDSIIVLLISIIIISIPLKIIRESFIELIGGTIQDKSDKEEIEQVIKGVISKSFAYSTFISKIGSSYLIVVYINRYAVNLTLKDISLIQDSLKKELLLIRSSLVVEINLGEN